eukprot:m.169066 g.169066  ORF g.169066 m.169066 type:complete len:352 (+) comp14764_c0_seq3:36-1091(+)
MVVKRKFTAWCGVERTRIQVESNTSRPTACSFEPTPSAKSLEPFGTKHFAVKGLLLNRPRMHHYLELSLLRRCTSLTISLTVPLARASHGRNTCARFSRGRVRPLTLVEGRWLDAWPVQPLVVRGFEHSQLRGGASVAVTRRPPTLPSPYPTVRALWRGEAKEGDASLVVGRPLGSAVHGGLGEENDVTGGGDRLVQVFGVCQSVDEPCWRGEVHLVRPPHDDEPAGALGLRGQRDRHGHERRPHIRRPALVLQRRVEPAIVREGTAVEVEAFRPFVLRENKRRVVKPVPLAAEHREVPRQHRVCQELPERSRILLRPPQHPSEISPWRHSVPCERCPCCGVAQLWPVRRS